MHAHANTYIRTLTFKHGKHLSIFFLLNQFFNLRQVFKQVSGLWNDAKNWKHQPQNVKSSLPDKQRDTSFPECRTGKYDLSSCCPAKTVAGRSLDLSHFVAVYLPIFWGGGGFDFWPLFGRLLYCSFEELTKQYWVTPEQEAGPSVLTYNFSYEQNYINKYKSFLSLIQMYSQLIRNCKLYCKKITL